MVRDRIVEVFATKPRDHWLAELQRIGVPGGPLLERDEWLDHDQIRAIGIRAEVDDPERGRVVMPGIPLTLSETPGSICTSAATCAQAKLPSWSATEKAGHDGVKTDPGNGPLTGIRVLDLGTVLAGHPGDLAVASGALST